MKKPLIIVVAVVAVIAIGLLSGVHYKNYQNKKAQANPTISVKQSDQRVNDVKTAAAGEYKSLVVQYNDAVAQCQKGVVAYAKLTVVQQHQTTPPVCPAPQT